MGAIRAYILLLSFVVGSVVLLSAKKKERVVNTPKQEMVYLEHSDRLEFDERRLPDAQLLKGNVRFRHDSALMYCDSAYFFQKTNSLHAFSNVRFYQGDTISGFGDILFYDGNTKRARFRHHVRLLHTTTTLSTDSLDYDRVNNIVYYYNGGVIYNDKDTLWSHWGQYTPPVHQAIFKTRVVLNNENMRLLTDTLWFNTETHLAELKAYTTIYCDTTVTILSDNGWYNTSTDQAMLLDRSHIIHKDHKVMTADTLFFNRVTGDGRLLWNIESIDSVQHITLYGNYGQMNEKEKKGFVTDSALLVDWRDSTDYMFMHADTFHTLSLQDTMHIPYTIQQDTLTIDTTRDSLYDYQLVKAFHTVRIYQTQQQAICDSLVYNGKDSIITLYTGPVCWSDSNQLSGEIITMYLNDSMIYVQNDGLMVQQYNDTLFNQMSCKNIYIYTRDGGIDYVDAQGNALTIFYPEDSGEPVGVNKTTSSNIRITFKNNKIDHLTFTTQTDGTLYPLDQITQEEQFMKNYFWAEHERPTSPVDVFTRPTLTERKAPEKRSATIEEDTDITSESKRGNKKRDKQNNKLKTR